MKTFTEYLAEQTFLTLRPHEAFQFVNDDDGPVRITFYRVGDNRQYRDRAGNIQYVGSVMVPVKKTS